MGRLGYYFGSERYGYQPDIITTAKGLASAYVPIGAMIASDRIAEPFMKDKAMFAHGFTFGGHLGRLRSRDGEPRHLRARRPLRARPGEGSRVSWDARGTARPPDRRRRARRGFLPGDRARQGQETKETFNDEESEYLLRGFLSGALYDRGLICRADDRGDPVIQLSSADSRFRAVRGDRLDPSLRPVGGVGAGGTQAVTRNGSVKRC